MSRFVTKGFSWFNTHLSGEKMFLVMHFFPLFAFFTQVKPVDWIICVVLYVVRMFFITAGYHRYFSHRAFKLNRFWQFIFAFMAQSSGQKGVLWWASHHREHHRLSDTPLDPHSPKQRGFWYSHVGWIFDKRYKRTLTEKIKDFAKYPEIRFLNEYDFIPPWVVGFTVWLIGGFSALWIGFFLSTIILYHSTFTINSLTHVLGKKRYETGDNSRNHWFLALTTMGEGWHNNHHFYPHSARMGWFWYEIDLTYYLLKVLSWLGIVKNLRPVPDRVRYAHRLKLLMQSNQG
ncbi:MAG: acyl-CoA desaturase [Leptospiraceae bacterium]|nr:acyl-CoA desaturase [Leptospiraceae bacterium]MDW8307425.1 acyl-CoA desaturase [Leptospiraceae bacterium]